MLQLDISRVSYPRVVAELIPIIPGGILAVGLFGLFPEWRAWYFGQAVLGYYAKIAVALFLIYVGGFVFMLLVNLPTIVLGAVLAIFLPRTALEPRPWMNPVVRRALGVFVGPAIAPANVDSNSLPAVAATDASAPMPPLQTEAETREWYWVYESVRRCLSPTTETSVTVWMNAATSIHSAAWASVLLLLIAPHTPWYFWLSCIVIATIGAVATFLAGFVAIDRDGSQLTARILQALRKAE